MWTTSVPCLCLCVFFEHVLVGFCAIEYVDAVETGAQCAMLSPLQRALRLVTGSYSACRVDFIFLRRRLTHLCREPRVPSWWLHVCVRSRASAVVTVVSDQTGH